MKYAYKTYEENMARAQGSDLSISMKQAIMITQFIRNKDVEKAKAALERVIKKEEPVPFTRFQNGLGHKPGMGAGRYPINACKEILAVLVAAEANAQNKGLGRCVIVHVAAQEARQPFHYGRRRRIKMRRAHVQIVLKETESAKKDSAKKDKKKTESKSETKSEQQ
jgi:large subunit ribosomal protein L22